MEIGGKLPVRVILVSACFNHTKQVWKITTISLCLTKIVNMNTFLHNKLHVYKKNWPVSNPLTFSLKKCYH